MPSSFPCGTPSCNEVFTTRCALTNHLIYHGHVASNEAPIPAPRPSEPLLRSSSSVFTNLLDGGNDDSMFNVDDDLVERDSPDSSLLDKFDSHSRSGLSSMSHPAEHICEIELLKLMKGVPLRLYDEVIEWAHKSSLAGVDFKKIKPRRRQAVLNNIRTRFDMTDVRPTTKICFIAWMPKVC